MTTGAEVGLSAIVIRRDIGRWRDDFIDFPEVFCRKFDVQRPQIILELRKCARPYDGARDPGLVNDPSKGIMGERNAFLRRKPKELLDNGQTGERRAGV